jgi:putative glycosyltransferase
MPKISLVTSVYKTAHCIPELYERSRVALQACTDSYEFIIVDDGSPDDIRAIALGLIDRDPSVRLIELSRNFGQHRAIMTGLRYATGDLIFMIDADLEERPELLEEFYRIMHAPGADVDVVYGVMEQRKGGAFERRAGAAFYWLMNRLSTLEIPRDILGARLMRREFVSALLEHDEAEPYIGGLMALTGFRQVAVPCEKTSRGTSSYTLRRKLRLASDALFGFSTAPLTLIAGLGGLIASATLIVGAIRAIAGDGGSDDTGFAVWSIWFLAGLLLSAVGIVGMYVGRVLVQARGRPVAIVRRVYGSEAD